MYFNQHKQQFVGQKAQPGLHKKNPLPSTCSGGGLELRMMLGIDFTRSNVRRFGKGWYMVSEQAKVVKIKARRWLETWGFQNAWASNMLHP